MGPKADLPDSVVHGMVVLDVCEGCFDHADDELQVIVEAVQAMDDLWIELEAGEQCAVSVFVQMNAKLVQDMSLV